MDRPFWTESLWNPFSISGFRATRPNNEGLGPPPTPVFQDGGGTSY